MNNKISNIAIAATFDNISKKYDLLNHWLSFGQDILWRKKVTQYIPVRANLKLLDMATGTADQLIALVKKCKNIDLAIGIDIARNMLDIAKNKIVKLNINDKVTLINENINHLSFKNNSIDIITISFGIRNSTDMQNTLSEIYRVLKPSGILIILEFSIPRNRFIRKIYLFYFRYILPKIGSLVSGDSDAYYYLNQSVEKFPYGINFVTILEKAGFINIQERLLHFGIATIYCAEEGRKHSLHSPAETKSKYSKKVKSFK